MSDLGLYNVFLWKNDRNFRYCTSDTITNKILTCMQVNVKIYVQMIIKPFHFKVMLYLNSVIRKLDFRLCGDKGADPIHSNCEADQCLCFRNADSTISLLLKSERLLSF